MLAFCTAVSNYYTHTTDCLVVDPVLSHIRQAGSLSTQPPAGSIDPNVNTESSSTPRGSPVSSTDKPRAPTQACQPTHADVRGRRNPQARCINVRLQSPHSDTPHSAGTVWKSPLGSTRPYVLSRRWEGLEQKDGWDGARLGMWSVNREERVWLQSLIRLLLHTVREKHKLGEREEGSEKSSPPPLSLHAVASSLTNQVCLASGAGWRRGIWLAN